jgi:hypothetical protein
MALAVVATVAALRDGHDGQRLCPLRPLPQRRRQIAAQKSGRPSDGQAGLNISWMGCGILVVDSIILGIDHGGVASRGPLTLHQEFSCPLFDSGTRPNSSFGICLSVPGRAAKYGLSILGSRAEGGLTGRGSRAS